MSCTVAEGMSLQFDNSFDSLDISSEGVASLRRQLLYPNKKRSVINDDPFLRDNEVCYLLCSKLLSSMLSFFDRFRWYDYFGEPAAS